MRVFIQRRVLRGLVATDRVEDASLSENAKTCLPIRRKKKCSPTRRFSLDVYLQNEEEDENEEENDTRTKLKSIQADRQRAYAEFGFLEIEFTTVYEYLHLLRLVSEKVNAVREDVIIIHAAAVSDFYIPWSELASHKIQSNALETSGSLFANFSSTPKMLKMCRDMWAPNAFCVSFKLETDASIIEQKTLSAMEKYNMHCIVANELDKRYNEVSIFQKRT